MFLAAMECQASRWIMKALIETNLDQEYASQEEMYQQNGEPAIESITAE